MGHLSYWFQSKSSLAKEWHDKDMAPWTVELTSTTCLVWVGVFYRKSSMTIYCMSKHPPLLSLGWFVLKLTIQLVDTVVHPEAIIMSNRLQCKWKKIILRKIVAMSHDLPLSQALTQQIPVQVLIAKTTHGDCRYRSLFLAFVVRKNTKIGIPIAH